METIIQKAIEGGWNPNNLTWTKQNIEWFLKQSDFKNNHEFVLDPLFWTALGKASSAEIWEGTTLMCNDCWLAGVGEKCKTHVPSWKYYALRFHEINLTEGWDKAVEYLYGLV